MEACVLGLTLDHHPCRNLRWEEAAGEDVLMVLDVPVGVREHKAKLALGASQLPFSERADDGWGQGEGARPGVRLRFSDYVVAVCSLADV